MLSYETYMYTTEIQVRFKNETITDSTKLIMLSGEYIIIVTVTILSYLWLLYVRYYDVGYSSCLSMQ